MKFKILPIVLFVFSALFIGCTDNNDTSDTGRLIVQLTDAPFPHDLVSEANVTVFKIEARNKDNETNIEESKMTDENHSPFTVLMEEEVQVNLLELTNGVTETLVDIEVPVGTYDLLRVYVKGINVVLEDGTTYDLKVPSGEQTGIKIFIKPGIIINGGLTADLLLDFDVSNSFVAKGNNKDLAGITGFNFKPVIKASNMSIAGTLAGMVTTVEEEMEVALEGAQVAIFAADTLNTTTFTDASGGYMVMGLLAGSYDVMVELEGYEPQTVESLPIIAANKTTQDFEMVLVSEGN